MVTSKNFLTIYEQEVKHLSKINELNCGFYVNLSDKRRDSD